MIFDVVNYGFVPNDPLADNTPKLNDLMSLNPSFIEVPKGQYYFKTKPLPISSRCRIMGAGIGSSVFIRDYSEPDHNHNFLHFTGAPIMEGFTIQSGEGHTGGCAIRLDGGGCNAGVLRDIRITGKDIKDNGIPIGQWSIPLILYGGTDEASGIREIKLDNLQLFAATHHLFWFVNVRGLWAKLCGYNAGGTAVKGVIQGTSAPNPVGSWEIRFDTHYLQELYLYNCHGVTMTHTGNLKHFTPANDCTEIFKFPTTSI